MQTPWLTPTPLPTSNPLNRPMDLSGFDFVYEYSEMMETGVNIWQSTNSTGTIDVLLAAVILMIVLLGLYSIWKRIEAL